jgi:predicted protein tyrosine phosphatase
MSWVCHASEDWAEKYDPEPGTVCISITEPLFPRGMRTCGPAKLRSGFEDVLRLEFQDYDPIKLIPDSTLINPQHKFPDDAVVMSEEQAAELAAYLLKHRGKNILVHCAAGISRSGAVAEVVLQAFPEYEDAGDPTRRWPNNHVRTLLKRALGLVPSVRQGSRGLV